MSRWRNTDTGVVVSVADSKDDRFDSGWELADKPTPAVKPAAKPAPKKSEPEK